MLDRKHAFGRLCALTLGLVRAFLRPYRAEFRIHDFPGASPQALVFRPLQGAGVHSSPFAVGCSPRRRFANTPTYVAPKWAQDFSLGRSPRSPQKSDQALKAL